MDWEDVFPLFAIAAVAALALALKATFGLRALRAQFADFANKYPMLDHRIVRLTEQIERLAPPPAAEEQAPTGAPEPPAISGAAEAEPPPEPATIPETRVESAEPVLAATAAPVAAPSRDWERILVENWLVWLGGATLALGGGFLVKLSIDYGLLTPSVRVVLAVLLGIGLSAAGEWLRRREVVEDAAGKAISYVPQALTAAGDATVFASLYAAHQLYALLPSGVAFVLLAITAGVTVAQSLWQGPYVAALGLVGAYTVPLLVESEAPQALPLFAYLAVVTAGSLALLRHRAWWWLGWLSLAGAMLWVVLWLAAAADREAPVMAGYLLVLALLFAALRQGVPRIGFLSGVADSPVVRVVTRTAFWAIAAGLLLLAHADRFGATSLFAAFALAVGLPILAYRDQALDDLVAIPGALAMALLASWELPPAMPQPSLLAFRIQPNQIGQFATAAIAFAALLGGGGFAMLSRVPRPGRWAAVSAAAPLLILVIAYWRLQQFDLDVAWTLTALALAVLELSAAAIVASRREAANEPDRQIEIALAAYAVGVLGSTIFAATIALGKAWLTVALALHLPAMGWIDGRFRLPALRWLALGVGAIVVVRLVLNPYVLSYSLGPTPVFNWLLYGYGIPAAAFVAATRQFGGRKDDWLVWVLEAGSAMFTLLLLTFELTHAMEGRLDLSPVDDFMAGAALIALWAVVGGALLALGEERRRPVLLGGGALVLGWTTLVALLWQPLVMLFGANVGELAIFDALLLANFVPALVFAAIAWRSGDHPVVRAIARVLAAMFAFAWVTLEIRHWFHHRVVLFTGSTEAEWYAYSVAWLVLAAGLLGFGLLRRSEWLRRAGLIGIGLVIGKVFLSDMAELTGVLRALSFIGLGGALVGLGYAYRRFRPLQLPQS